MNFSLFAVVLSAAAMMMSAATVTVEFTPSLQFAETGQTLLFSGTLTNTGTGTAYVTGDLYTSVFPLDDSPFLANVPEALAAGESVTAPLFRVNVPAGAAAGLVTGTFSVVGGDTPGSQDILDTRNFGIQVVPEPSTGRLTAGVSIAVVLYALARRYLRPAVA